MDIPWLDCNYLVFSVVQIRDIAVFNRRIGFIYHKYIYQLSQGKDISFTPHIQETSSAEWLAH